VTTRLGHELLPHDDPPPHDEPHDDPDEQDEPHDDPDEHDDDPDEQDDELDEHDDDPDEHDEDVSTEPAPTVFQSPPPALTRTGSAVVVVVGM
jgi:hypothetical protein